MSAERRARMRELFEKEIRETREFLEAERHRQKPSPEEIDAVLSSSSGAAWIDLRNFEVEPNVLQLLPADVARRNLVVPVNRVGQLLIVAATKALTVDARREIAAVTGLRIDHVLASRAAVREALERHYPTPPAGER